MAEEHTDLDLWHQYRRGSDVAKNELLDRMMPHIRQRSALYRDVPIPESAILGHAQRRALEAFETYDPSKGTQLSTHVVNHLQRVSRFVNQGKNIARIPEPKFLQLNLFQSQYDSLMATHGRPPSIEELTDVLHWTPQQVQSMAKSLKQRDLSASSMPESAEGSTRDRMHETLSFVRFGLKPDERTAFDHFFGYAGKPILGMPEIAKKTGLSVDKLYRLKQRTTQDVQNNF